MRKEVGLDADRIYLTHMLGIVINKKLHIFTDQIKEALLLANHPHLYSIKVKIEAFKLIIDINKTIRFINKESKKINKKLKK